MIMSFLSVVSIYYPEFQRGQILNLSPGKQIGCTE